MGSKEVRQEYLIEYRQRNRERIKTQDKIYYEQHKKEIFLRMKRNIRKQRPILKAKLFQILGGACCCFCGYCKDTRVLQFEHINDDGYTDRKRFNGSVMTMYRYYIKHPEEARQKLQVTCANCNLEKLYNTFTTQEDSRDCSLYS